MTKNSADYGDFQDLNIVWEDVKLEEYAPLEGKFIAEVVNAEVKKNLQEGKAGVKLEYELLEGRVGMKVGEYFNLKHPGTYTDKRTGETKRVDTIGQGQYKKRCLDMGFSEVPGFAHDTIGKKVILKLKAEASNQLNPNTGEPYVNSVVKNSWPVDVIGKSAAPKDVVAASAVDEDIIPF